MGGSISGGSVGGGSMGGSVGGGSMGGGSVGGGSVGGGFVGWEMGVFVSWIGVFVRTEEGGRVDVGPTPFV